MIKIICFGKLKENYLINAVNDYYERVNKYHKISILELKDSDNMNDEEKEYYKLLKYLGYNNKDRIIISTLSYFLILLISFILSMVVFSLFFVFVNIFIKNHPFIMNGFKIIFDFNVLFKIAIVVLLTTILCLISNLIIIKDDNNV